MASYSISAGPLGYVYLAEISTLTLRAKTISMALFFTQCQNFFGTYAVPYMLNGKGFGIIGTAAFFAGAGAIGWVIVYFTVPETKGRSYVELDELFEGRVAVRKFKQTVTSIDIAKRDSGN
jgi:SP family general alpha glucoside:H+ symporter-like MFS transporter